MVDLHLHTIHSDGTASVREMLALCEKLKLKAISITDHNSIDAYKEIESENLHGLFGGKLLVGIELSATVQGIEIEILGYGIDWQKMDKLIPNDMKGNCHHVGLTFQKVIGMIRQCDGKAVLAHPGRYKHAVELVIDKIDGIEVYHLSNSQEYRQHLLELCREHNLIITGGSDFHGTSEPQLINCEKLPYEMFEQFANG